MHVTTILVDSVFYVYMCILRQASVQQHYQHRKIVKQRYNKGFTDVQ